MHRTKSNHMLQYYRKQSDKKMIQSISRMKSQLSDNFSQQKYNRTPTINKSKRQMAQILKKQKIAQENKSLIYRIKQVRQKTMKDNMKYLDTTHCERLTNTRNTFRRKAKEQKNKQVHRQNQIIIKRLVNAKSQYSFRTSSNDITDKQSIRNSKKFLLKREKSKKSIDLNIGFQTLTKGELYLDSIEKQLQKTQKIQTLSKTSLVNLNNNKKRNSIQNKRNQTQTLEIIYNMRKVSELLEDRTAKVKSTVNSNNPQQKNFLLKKTSLSNHKIESASNNNDLTKIPLKSRQIKLEVIKNPPKKRLPTEYERNIKRQIEAKGAWGNEWLKSYRIVV